MGWRGCLILMIRGKLRWERIERAMDPVLGGWKIGLCGNWRIL